MPEGVHAPSDEAARELAAPTWRATEGLDGVLEEQLALPANEDGVVEGDVHEDGPAAVQGDFHCQ